MKTRNRAMGTILELEIRSIVITRMNSRNIHILLQNPIDRFTLKYETMRERRNMKVRVIIYGPPVFETHKFPEASNCARIPERIIINTRSRGICRAMNSTKCISPTQRSSIIMSFTQPAIYYGWQTYFFKFQVAHTDNRISILSRDIKNASAD